jgi:two-component system, OmpR family, catabolic regulation response regulator CreB
VTLADGRGYAVAAMQQVLIVEDEMSIADALTFALEADGFQVHWVRLGRDGIETALARPVELVILDIGLPDVSGLEVCKAIRKHSDVPILFLTARGDEIDRIVGLEIGADDYVVKPFSPREVAARVRVILKRARGALPGAPDVQAGDAAAPARPNPEPKSLPTQPEFVIDADALRVQYLGAWLILTAQEYRLLVRLVSNPGRVFARGQLLEVIGAGVGAAYERNIDTHIKSLRSKLREINAEREPILTHRGFGYSYRPLEN